MVADWKKTPRKERPAFLEAGINELIASVQPLLTSLGTLPLDEVRSAVESSGEIKSVKGSIGSIKVDVKKCPICDSHHISAAITNITNNKKPKTTSIATINKPEQPVAPVIA